MLKSAQRIIFCLDHTKFNRRSVSSLCELDVVDTIVTDAQAPADLVDQLKQTGIEVVVAD
jgi:DeoR/GlpR family transcriptional regulator of sugar metabolism